MANSTGSGTVFRRVPRAERGEIGHSIDAFFLKFVQVVVRHAIGLSHESDIYCSMLNLLLIPVHAEKTYDERLQTS